MAKSRATDDRPKLWLVRQPQGLVAATPMDLEALERFKIGSRLVCHVEQPKDDNDMRFIHALMNNVAKAMGEDPESFKFWLKVKAGLWKGLNLFDGTTQIQPKSLREIGQDELRDFIDKAVEIITSQVVPGADVEQLLEDANAYSGQFVRFRDI